MFFKLQLQQHQYLKAKKTALRKFYDFFTIICRPSSMAKRTLCTLGFDDAILLSLSMAAPASFFSISRTLSPKIA